jgi:hypothetical protein
MLTGPPPKFHGTRDILLAAVVKEDRVVTDTPNPAKRLEHRAVRDADALAGGEWTVGAAAKGAIDMWRARWQPPNAVPCVIAKAMDPKFGCASRWPRMH